MRNALVLLIALGSVVSFLPLGAPVPLPAPDWKIEDDLDDVAVRNLPTSGSNNPIVSHIDIVRVTIDSEDEAGLFLNIILRELRVATSEGFNGALAEYDIEFKHDASALRYFLRLDLYGRYEGDVVASYLAGDFSRQDSFFCIAKEDECPRNGWSRVSNSPIALELVDDANAIRVFLPKDYLMGAGRTRGDGTPMPRPEALRKDDHFVDFQVTTEAHAIPTGPMGGSDDGSDVAPDEGENADPYALRFETANTVVRLQVATGGSTLGVIQGQEQVVPFTITNSGEGKRIVSLEFLLIGPAEKVGEYQVSGPSSVTVPGGSFRNYTFILGTSSAAAPGDQVSVLIKGTSLGRANEFARTSTRLAPTAPVLASNPVLYFHARDTADDPTFSPIFCQTSFDTCTSGFLSAHASPPGASSSKIIEMNGGFGSCNDAYCANLALDTPLASPIMLTTGKVDLMVHFVPTAQALNARVSANFLVGPPGGQTTLFQFSTEAPIASGGETIDLGGSLRLPKDKIVPAGEQMRLFISVDMEFTDPGRVVRGLDIDASKSLLRLPLVELPEEYKTPTVPSPFQVSVAGDREDFVNPGESRLYNLSILNQSPEPQRVDLTGAISHPGWTVQIVPATAFMLEPGDTVTVGVIVGAPKEAPDGESAVVRFNATSATGAFTMIRLNTIVVTQIDVPDDTLAFKADPDDLKKEVAPPVQKSPGPGAALAGLLAAAAGISMRRRRA